jgi:hypothetical protein
MGPKTNARSALMLRSLPPVAAKDGGNIARPDESLTFSGKSDITVDIVRYQL